ncbi:hypothetical protein EVAR_90573_1 [Eumeta japonica]|uniref:Uncharacterized protein n=1 Tax=Eumeta variegata TaxID=151549 RepID=A0A4C1YV65_EUMVA|nr:hypothetical protein EVAR_90573_1 [Eumeta japonica]
MPTQMYLTNSKYYRTDSAEWCPWSVTILHRDLHRPMITKLMKDKSKKFFDMAANHLKLLLVTVATYEAPPPHHFLHRPRNVLIDPPHDFTSKIERLIDTNNMFEK